ncbi:MAG: LON peptidase substrate-binding domain-containing protein [Myxococcales bacterium]|nr:LON peptidase substrate-binding domain-containing protein [Myxococcales bacterium]
MSTRTPLVDERIEHVPVLPLPEYVLFPHTLIPFHIFEPRYRQMTEDALAGGRHIIVAGLKPGWERDYYQSPPTYRIAGLGKIVNEQRLKDGRFDLYVHGLARITVELWEREVPYRTATIRVLHDHIDERMTDRIDATRRRLLNLTDGLVRVLGSAAGPFSRVQSSTTDLGVLTNRLASMVPASPVEKQRLLETLCPVARAELLMGPMSELMLAVSQLTNDPINGSENIH